MRFTIEHPVGRPGCDPELLGSDGMAEFARAAEAAGFDALAFTEHPAPSHKWMSNGGHASLDPLVGLSYCAAVTRRIRLLTYLLILPYRNPLVVAKSIASVDLLSNGRLTLGVGGGYLRSEFSAVGARFEDRGALTDEALEVLRRVFVEDEFRFEGRHFAAYGVTMAPKPVQLPHPPVWVGGNGRNARSRVARLGQGWSPLLLSAERAATTRTPSLATPAELAVAVRELQDLTADAGRDPAALDIQVQSPLSDADPSGGVVSAEQVRDHIGQLADAGATWFVVRVRAVDRAAALDAVPALGGVLGIVPPARTW